MTTTYSNVSTNEPLPSEELGRDLFFWGVDASDIPAVLEIIEAHMRQSEKEEINIVLDRVASASNLPSASDDEHMFKNWSVAGSGLADNPGGYIHIGYAFEGDIYITAVRPDLEEELPVEEVDIASQIAHELYWLGESGL